MSFIAEYAARLIADSAKVNTAPAMSPPQGDRTQRASRAFSQRHTKGGDPYNYVGGRL